MTTYYHLVNYFLLFSYNGDITTDMFDPSPQLQQAFLGNTQATPTRKPGRLAVGLNLSLCYSKPGLLISSPVL